MSPSDECNRGWQTLTCNLVWVAIQNATEYLRLAPTCHRWQLLSHRRAPRHPFTQWGGEIFTFELPLRLRFVNTGKVERKCDLSEKPLLNTGRLQLRGGMLKPTSAFTLRCTPPRPQRCPGTPTFTSQKGETRPSDIRRTELTYEQMRSIPQFISV